MLNRPNLFGAFSSKQAANPLYRSETESLVGIRQQLDATDVVLRVAALQKALDYGEAGLDLVIEVLQEDYQRLGWAAYGLLLKQPALKAQDALNRHGLQRRYEAVSIDVHGQTIRRAHKCTHVLRESLEGVALDLVPIAGSSFAMGSSVTEEGRRDWEGPQHQVRIPTFWMGICPVTQAQYQAVMGNNPSRFKGENRPVEGVSWHDAVAFCERLSQQLGRPYRLPSEAEWEYACRAKTTTPFYVGPTITPDLANYRGYKSYGVGPRGIYRRATTDVGQFPSNGFGLYDMHGNVWEWCADHWHDNYSGAPTDGSAWVKSEDVYERVLRGGSWLTNPDVCRSAVRVRGASTITVNDVGFRVVCGGSETSSL